jgi:ribosomal protein L37E
MSHADEQQARATVAVGLPSCPACGARALRAAARYCATCGRGLRERDYRPADRLRASYRWPSITQPPARRALPVRPAASWRHRNEQTARGYVFLAYALLPFVGVVFCACAVACCTAGLCEAMRAKQTAAEFEARRGLAYTVLLAGAQAFIWLVAFYLPWRALS